MVWKCLSNLRGSSFVTTRYLLSYFFSAQYSKRYHRNSCLLLWTFWGLRPRLTSGQVQRLSVFERLRKHNRLRPEPIRFVRLDCEHAQSDGKSVNRGLPVLDLTRGRQRSPEVAILGADQKERGLWGRECPLKGHSQLAHMRIRYHFIANLHITETR